MAIHSSVRAWRVPGTEESVGLPMYGVAESRTQLTQLSSSSSLYVTFFFLLMYINMCIILVWGLQCKDFIFYIC